MEDMIQLANLAAQQEAAKKKPEEMQNKSTSENKVSDPVAIDPAAGKESGQPDNGNTEENHEDPLLDPNLDLENGNGESDDAGIPEDLKEYESILKSRKWDGLINDPKALLKETLKSYSEAEKAISRKGEDESTLVNHVTELQNAMMGDAAEINKIRVANGFAPLDVVTPEKVKHERDTAFAMMNRAFEAIQLGKHDYEAEQYLVNWKNEGDKLVERDAIVKQTRGEVSTNSNVKIRQNAEKVISSLIAETKQSREDVLKNLDAVYKNPVLNQLLTSLYGPRPEMLIQTPERGKALLELAKIVTLADPKTREADINAAVKKEIDRIRKARGAGGSGTSQGSGQRKQTTTEADLAAARMFMPNSSVSSFIR